MFRHSSDLIRHSSGLMNKRNALVLIILYPSLQIISSWQSLGHLGKVAFCIYNGSRFPDSLQETFDRMTVTVPFSLRVQNTCTSLYGFQFYTRI